MNILYICPRFPYPPCEGDKVVIYNHLKFLSRKHKITLLSLIKDDRELEGIDPLCPYCSRIEIFKKRSNFSLWNIIAACVRPDPFTVIRYHSPAMFRRSRELIESAEFDIIHCSQYYMAQYVIDKKITVPKKTAIILDTHHIQFLLYGTFLRYARHWLIRLLAAIETSRIKKYEVPLYEKFDRCLAATASDRDVMRKLSGATNIAVNTFCLDLASDTEGQGGEKDKSEEEGTIGFFGTFNSLPNRDGLTFFYEDIFPLIQKEIPNCTFVVAGNLPYRFRRRLARDPAVRIMGFVPDIRRFLKQIAVVVVPLRVVGGGITIKILDSWAVGKAVVSTSSAAGGMRREDGTDIIIADSPEDFAQAVIGLLRDKKKREAIGGAAVTNIRQQYHPEKVIGNLEAIYEDTLRKKGRQA